MRECIFLLLAAGLLAGLPQPGRGETTESPKVLLPEVAAAAYSVEPDAQGSVQYTYNASTTASAASDTLFSASSTLAKRLDEDAEDDSVEFKEYQGVMGRPGVDFPVLPSIPQTSFSCRKVKGAGYYADLETDCQVFHICDGGRKISFLCPNGTVFRQSHLICDWWFKVDCAESEGLYESSAEQLAADQEAIRERQALQAQRAVQLAATTPRTDSAYTKIIGSTERRHTVSPTAPTTFRTSTASSGSNYYTTSSSSSSTSSNYQGSSRSSNNFQDSSTNNFPTTPVDGRSSRTFHGQTAPGGDSFTFNGNRNSLQRQQISGPGSFGASGSGSRSGSAQSYVTGPGGNSNRPTAPGGDVFGNRNRVTNNVSPSVAPTASIASTAASPRGRGVQGQFRFNKNQQEDAPSFRSRPSGPSESARESFATAESNGPRTPYRKEDSGELNYPPGVNPYLKVTSTPQLQPKKKLAGGSTTTVRFQYTSSSDYRSSTSTTTPLPEERQELAETASFAGNGRGSSRFSFGIGRPLETQYVEAPSFESRVVSEPPSQLLVVTTAAPNVNNIYRLQANSKTYAEIKRQRQEQVSTTPSGPTPFYRKYQSALRSKTATPDGASPTPTYSSSFGTTKYVELQRSRTASYSTQTTAPTYPSSSPSSVPPQPTRDTPREPPTTRYITLARIIPKPGRQASTLADLAATTEQPATTPTTESTTEFSSVTLQHASLKTLELSAPSPQNEDISGNPNTTLPPSPSAPGSAPGSLALYFAAPEDDVETPATELPTTVLPTGPAADGEKISISDVLLLPHANVNFTDFTGSGQDGDPDKLPSSLTQLTKNSYTSLFADTEPPSTTVAYETTTYTDLPTKPDINLNANNDLHVEQSRGIVEPELSNSIPADSKPESRPAEMPSIADNADLRELAQVFTRALSAYLEDPESFRKVLAEVRPTEPPPSTPAEEATTAPSTATNAPATEVSPTTQDETSVTKESDEVLEYSDVSKSSVRKSKLYEVTPTPYLPIIFPVTPNDTLPSTDISPTTTPANTLPPLSLNDFPAVDLEAPLQRLESLLDSQSRYYSSLQSKTTLPPDSSNYTSIAADVNSLIAILSALNESWTGPPSGPSGPFGPSAGTADDPSYFPTAGGVQDGGLPRYGGFQNNSKYSPYGADVLRARGVTPPGTTTRTPTETISPTTITTPSALKHEIRKENLEKIDNALGSFAPEDLNQLAIINTAAENASLALRSASLTAPSAPSGPLSPTGRKATPELTAGGSNALVQPDPFLIAAGSQSYVARDNVVAATPARTTTTTTTRPASTRPTTQKITTIRPTPKPASKSLPKASTRPATPAPKTTQKPAPAKIVQATNATPTKKPKYTGPVFVTPTHVPAASSTVAVRSSLPPSTTTTTTTTSTTTTTTTPRPTPPPTTTPVPTTQQVRFRGAKYLTTPETLTSKPTSGSVPVTVAQSKILSRPTAPSRLEQSLDTGRRQQEATRYRVNLRSGKATSFDLRVPSASATSTDVKRLPSEETLNAHKPLNPLAINYELTTSPTTRQSTPRTGIANPTATTPAPPTTYHPKQTPSSPRPSSIPTASPTTRSTPPPTTRPSPTPPPTTTTRQPATAPPTVPPTAPPEDNQSSTWVLPAGASPTSDPAAAVPRQPIVTMSMSSSVSSDAPNLEMNHTMEAAAEAMFGHLNATMADMFMNMLKEAETNMTIRRLVLLLVNEQVSGAADGSALSALEARDQLLEALLNTRQTRGQGEDRATAASSLGQPIAVRPSSTTTTTTTTTQTIPSSTTTPKPPESSTKRKHSRRVGKTVHKTVKTSSSETSVFSRPKNRPSSTTTTSTTTTWTSTTTTRRPPTTASSAAAFTFITDPVLSTVLPQYSGKKPTSSEELALASSDSRAVELLRSLYSLAAQWG